MMDTTREELIYILIQYAADDYKDEQADLIESIVDDAIEEVRNVRYPFGYKTDAQCDRQTEEVLRHYRSNIRRIMEYHYDKIGKEGVTTFYESGQTTSWESGGTPDSYFKGIIPISNVLTKNK